MSDQQPARPPGPTPGRNPWITALLILIGIILLLPGLCSLIFAGVMVAGGGYGGSSEVLALLLVCLAVGAGGVALIAHAIRR